MKAGHIHQVSAHDGLLQQAKDALPALHERAVTVSGPEGVRTVISRRFAVFPQPQRSEGEWAAWWMDYTDVLADLPLSALEAGMRVYVASPDAEFLPKPGALRALAMSAFNPDRVIYENATNAVNLALEREYADPRPLPAPEHRLPQTAEARAEMLASVRALIADMKHRPRGPELPPVRGPVDEHGVTPQLRAIMARRAS